MLLLGFAGLSFMAHRCSRVLLSKIALPFAATPPAAANMPLINDYGAFYRFSRRWGLIYANLPVWSAGGGAALVVGAAALSHAAMGAQIVKLSCDPETIES